MIALRHIDRNGIEYLACQDGEDYFEIYADSQIEVREIEQAGIAWVAIVVDGAVTLMHQRKFEAGRSHLRKNVEELAKVLSASRRTITR